MIYTDTIILKNRYYSPPAMISFFGRNILNKEAE